MLKIYSSIQINPFLSAVPTIWTPETEAQFQASILAQQLSALLAYNTYFNSIPQGAFQ